MKNGNGKQKIVNRKQQKTENSKQRVEGKNGKYSFVFLHWFSRKLRNHPYSHLFNKRGGWNKRGGGAKVAKSLNVELGINVEGGIFWKNLVHKSNKRGVEGGKI